MTAPRRIDWEGLQRLFANPAPIRADDLSLDTEPALPPLVDDGRDLRLTGDRAAAARARLDLWRIFSAAAARQVARLGDPDRAQYLARASRSFGRAAARVGKLAR